MITILTFIFWVATLQVPATAQGPVAPRAQARATVAGTTVRADVSDSLSFVTLKLTPLDEPATAVPIGRGGPVFSNINQVTSDATGQFLFSSVAPGRYSISAEREGYVPAEQFQTGPRQPIQSILTITAGMKLDGLTVTMIPVPTISGTVFGPLGQRLAGATVQAYRVQYTPYGRQLVRAGSVLSHEGGEYRLFRLAPGYYYVSASYSDMSRRPWQSALELSPNLTSPDAGYSTVYYPAELKVADARVFNLYNGAVSSADIIFRETPYFNLSVKVRLPPAQEKVPPLRITKLAVMPVGADLGSAADYAVQGSGTAFSVEHLPEGEYVVVALADMQDGQGGTYSGIVSDTLRVRLIENTEVEIAAMYPFILPVSVSRAIAFSLQDGLKIELVRADANANQTLVANVNASGQFALAGIGPGTYDVFVRGVPANVFLQEVRLGRGRIDDLQRGFQIRVDSSLPPRTWRCDAGCTNPQLVSDVALEVLMTAGASPLGGQVVDYKGGSVVGAKIVLVPTDPIIRQRKDRYGLTYSDASGAFLVPGILPGSYIAFAFEQIEPDIYFDSEFNEQMSRLGTPVEITNRPIRTLDRPLTVITRDDVARLTR